MDFASFDEFWKALGRLYDSTLENKEAIRELRASIKDLDSVAAKTLSAVQQLHAVVTDHERRLDPNEITVEAILEDLRRHREGPSPQ
ncbi:MAG: hypothetical protein WAM71_06890 [Candidatus Korobacteraceae bacterium]